MVPAVAAAGLIAACDGSPGDSLEVGGRKLDDAEQSDQSGGRSSLADLALGSGHRRPLPSRWWRAAAFGAHRLALS